MTRLARIAAAVAVALAGAARAPAVPAAMAGDEVVVSAASSLTDLLQEIAPDCERTTGVRVRLNLGGSNALARQIVNGAPADVFLSADAAQMDVVERAGLVEPGTRRDWLANQLAVIVRGSGISVSGPRDLLDRRVRRIAVGDPAAVPSGVYARAYLERHQLWPVLQDRLVPFATVRGALAAVASGDADAGIVFATDARVATVRLAFVVPRDAGPRIVYPMALVRGRATPAARKVFDYLRSEAARAACERFGFIPLDGSRR
jgi:molybdate transport system substrate-binding protein